jgi:hypothetical protein
MDWLLFLKIYMEICGIYYRLMPIIHYLNGGANWIFSYAHKFVQLAVLPPSRKERRAKRKPLDSLPSAALLYTYNCPVFGNSN